MISLMANMMKRCHSHVSAACELMIFRGFMKTHKDVKLDVAIFM